MTAAVMPTQLDIGETFQLNRRNSAACRAGMYLDQQQWQMSTTTTTLFLSRHRNLSGPCPTTCTPTTLDNRALATPPPGVPSSRDSRAVEKEGPNNGNNMNNRPSKEGSNNRHGSSQNRKLDRSLSDSEDRINGNNGGRGVNSSRYKTELCRPFEESGHCKYGDKCQFAHGAHELRNLSRHPKYKTELCRTYHSIGFCPYGPRCHFIHKENEKLITQRKNSHNGSSPRVSSSAGGGRQCSMIMPNSTDTPYPQRPRNLCGLNSLGSSFESVSSSSSPENQSPSHLEDTFPPIGTFSPSDSETVREGLGRSEAGRVFNFPASDAASIGSIMTPLNIQTQQMYGNNMNVMDSMQALARFSAVMNLSQNQQNNQSSFQANLNACQQARHQQQAALEQPESCWSSICGESTTTTLVPDVALAFPPPSSSPHSSSDDSMGSNGSLEMIPVAGTATPATLVNCPHDLGRAMRLPIFNKFSADADS